MAGNAQLIKAYPPSGGVIALAGVTTGNTTSTAGLILQPKGANNIAADSLCANISAGITTTSLVVVPQWQVSNNGTTWTTLLPMNGAAYVALATGTGSLVTTTYALSAAGLNLAYPYVRLAVVSTGATGAAGDNVTVSYNWNRQFIIGGG